MLPRAWSWRSLAAGTLVLSMLATGGDARAQVRRVDQASGTDALLIAVSPVDEAIVWASGQRGTWRRTTDGGETWHGGQVPGAEALQFRDVHAVDARTAYLLSTGEGAHSRIYKTTDAGATWTLQFTNDDPRGFYDCFDFWTADHGIVVGDAIDGRMAMLTTRDGGATWTRVPPDTLPAAPDGEGSFAASGTCLRTGPAGRAWVVASTPDAGRVVMTTDYGHSWLDSRLPISTHKGVGAQSVGFRDVRHGFALGGGYDAQPDDVLAAVTEDGGRTWTARTRPPLPRGVWGAAWVPGTSTPVIVAVGPDGAVLSRDDARSWEAIDGHTYWAVACRSSICWAVGAGGRVTRLGGF